MILVTGSNGFVGRALVDRLKFQFDEIRLLDRNSINRNSNFPYYQMSINSVGNYNDALIGCDVVIHCAAKVHSMNENAASSNDLYKDTNILGTLNLAKQAVKAGVKRFIFLSSIKAVGEHTLHKIPFHIGSECNPEDDYGNSKREAELGLLHIAKESDLEVVIIRPTLVYGPYVKGNFELLMRLISKGIPLPVGCLKDNHRSLVSVVNLVDLLATCVDHPRASNQIFLVSDDEDISTSEMVYEMSKILGKTNLQLPVPKFIFKLFGDIFGKQKFVDRLIGSLQVDITHTKDTLDWIPPQSLEDGFNQTAQAFLVLKQK